MPPEAVEARVMDCSESIVGLEGAGLPAFSNKFTVTVSADEHAWADGVPWDESDTL